MPVINLKIDTRCVRSSGILLFDYQVEQDNRQSMSLRMMINGFPVDVYGGQLQSVVFSYPAMDQPPIIWSCNDDDIQRRSDVIKENLYEASDEASDYASDDAVSDNDEKNSDAEDALLLLNQDKEENNDICTASDTDWSMEIYRVPKSSDDDKLSAESVEESNIVYISSSDEETSTSLAQLESVFNQWQEMTKPKVA